MAVWTISEAARRCGVARTTLQRAIRSGRLALTVAHKVEEVALVQAGYLPAEGVEVLRLQHDNTQLRAQAGGAGGRGTGRRKTGGRVEERKKNTATLRAVRFTAGDVSQPVDFTLVLRREEAERLCRDLQRLLDATPRPVEIVAKWVGTLREEAHEPWAWPPGAG